MKGLEDERDAKGLLLGNFTYADNGDALQSFPVPLVFGGTGKSQAAAGDRESRTPSASEVAGAGGPRSFRFVEVRVLENHGHPSYTCLYRVRVHGTPVSHSQPRG